MSMEDSLLEHDRVWPTPKGRMVTMAAHSVASRKRRVQVGVVMLGVVLAGMGALAAARSTQGAVIYTVVGLQRQVLHEHRDRWMGRTVLVQGIVPSYLGFPPPERGPLHLVLLDVTQRQGRLGALPLTRGGENPALQRWRDVPLIGRLLPPPHVLAWGEPVVYRVTLQPRPDTSCDLCFTAEITDAWGPW